MKCQYGIILTLWVMFFPVEAVDKTVNCVVGNNSILLQAEIDTLSWNSTLTIRGTCEIHQAISLPITRIKVDAYGAKFIIKNDDMIAFDLNPDAPLDPAPGVIESTHKSHGYWYGGEFISDVANPTRVIAFKVYGVRQMRIEDVIFGSPLTYDKRLTSGIQFSGLGGHLFQNNRFYHVDVAFDAPIWANSDADVSGVVTTSNFKNNQFTLKADKGQKAFYVRSGWSRWNIEGGFVNGSSVSGRVNAVFHFTDERDSRMLNITGVGFEQARPNSKFIWIESVASRFPSYVNLSNNYFSGDPASGGLVVAHFPRTAFITSSGNRIEATAASGNVGITTALVPSPSNQCKGFRYSSTGSYLLGCN